MKKIILLGGVLASGKSTYSLMLKEKYNLTTINKDRLKEILGDNIYVTNREENKKLSVISFDLMKYLLDANMNTIILESNFKDYELKDLKEICEELKYDVLSIVFDGDNKVLHKRFLDRLEQNRHYVHKSQDLSNIDDFIRIVDGLRNLNYFGQIINVDATTFDYQYDNELFNKIEDFINNE